MLPRRDERLLVCAPCSMSVLGPPCSSCTVGLTLVEALPPPHSCADASPPRPTVSFNAATAFIPPLHAPTVRGTPPPYPELATTAARRVPRLARATRPLLTTTRHDGAPTSYFPSFPPTLPLRDRGSASGCIAPRLAVARCTPRPCAASNISAAASIILYPRVGVATLRVIGREEPM